MKGVMVLCVAGAITALASVASAQSLATGAPNNGSGGVFMDLTALTNDLQVTGFEVAYTGTVGTFVDVEVWTRPGSYVGFDADPTGWTLTQTVSGERLGTLVLSPLALTTNINLVAGQTLAVYLHAISAGGGIRYNGTTAAPPQTLWSNGDLELFSDVSRTGAIPFGGSRFAPRTFAGVVHYIPAPASMALVGAAGLLTLRRRR